MTDAREYCPGCEPDADPDKELIVVNYCSQHVPARDGVHDNQVNSLYILVGSQESGGAANKAYCDMLHRGETK